MRIALVLMLAATLPAQAAPPPPPYSLPWQLRPVGPVNVVRLDTSVAVYESGGKTAETIASMFLISYKVKPWFAPMIRMGGVWNFPTLGPPVLAVVNPALGGTFGIPLPKGFRLGLFVGLTIPVGRGGGNNADPGEAAAARAGVLARSAMDNAMFAVNDLTVFPGFDLAWVGKNLTVQVEATVLQLFRVRGEKVAPDEYRTNFTTGLHIGYFFIPELSAGVDLRYQTWLSTPVAVKNDKTGSLRDTATFAVGVRGHFKMGDKTWFRPGLSYTHGLDDPMNAQSYHVVQVDLPFNY